MPFRPNKAFIQSVREFVAQAPAGLTAAEVRARFEPLPRPAVVAEALARLVTTGELAVIDRQGMPTYVATPPAGPSAGRHETSPGSTSEPAVPAPGPELMIDRLAPVPSTASAVKAEPASLASPAAPTVPPGPGPGPVETLADAPQLAEIFEATVGLIVTAKMAPEQATLLFQRGIL